MFGESAQIVASLELCQATNRAVEDSRQAPAPVARAMVAVRRQLARDRPHRTPVRHLHREVADVEEGAVVVVVAVGAAVGVEVKEAANPRQASLSLSPTAYRAKSCRMLRRASQ